MSHDQDYDNAMAIVGMSCRFAPDLTSPEALWEHLMGGRSAVSEMPEKRWRPYASTSPEATAILRETTLLGSYLEDIEGFDAEFFGISPKEAGYLDPQQRFMLELTWEALVNAGIPPTSLRGSDTGVYAAVNSTDYGRRVLEDMTRTGPYAVNGTTDYGIANRVSYVLDTRGPSMAVSTACAATLTAVHVAVQALRSAETSLAIVGGLNIISTPALNVALEGAGALAPDGRSKAYDEAANGYGRGEGAGVLILKRLQDARADGDRVLAVIRGSGVFQDGHSDGMMAPNADAQAHMLETVYERANIDPATVGYVEAHGTGTPSGDGAELSALSRVIGAERDTPCVIGSIKPNIGHVEGGSGMAGIIKVVLALQNETVPPSLHADPTHGTDWAANGLTLPAGPVDWPLTPGTPRRAGVSNYGVGGTIAHVIIEEAPPSTEPAQTVVDEDGPHVVPLSSMSATAVRELATLTGQAIQNSTAPLGAMLDTWRTRRSHLPERAAVVTSGTDLTQVLARLGANEAHPDVVHGRVVPGTDRGAVWVFSGHGSQWDGMGRDLLDVDEAFTNVIEDLAGVYDAELGWTPREKLTAGGPWSTMEVQALTFALQAALAGSWSARGLAPAAVLGHSVGEIAAAYVAGVLDLLGAATFACRRARALDQVSGSGAMAMVDLSFEDAAKALDGINGVVAAISASPSSTVISGRATALTQALNAQSFTGVNVRTVATDLAFHSPEVDPVLAEVTAGAEHLRPAAARVPLYSTALTDPRGADARGPAYWGQNLRAPVMFLQGAAAAMEDGYRVFLEVSSHPLVTHSLMEIAESRGHEIAAIPTMRRDEGSPRHLARATARLFCAGVAPAWTGPSHKPVDLPGVAWQHRPYWLFADAAAQAGFGAGHDPAEHDLLGGRYAVGGSTVRQVWQTRVDLDSRPYPLDHALDGVEVTPAASILNSFLKSTGEPTGIALEGIVLRTPLAVEPPRTVQIVREGQAISLSSRIADQESSEGDDWILHASALLEPARPLGGHVDGQALRSRLPVGDWDRLDTMFRNMGVGGYAFPWELDELHRSHDEQFAVLTLDEAADTTSWAHVIDGALTISATLVSPEDAQSLWMSRAIDHVAVTGIPPARIAVHSRRSMASPEDSVDVDIAGPDGRVVARVRGLAFSSVEHGVGTANPKDLVHEVAWRDLPEDLAARPVPARVTVLGHGPRAERVREILTAAGASTSATVDESVTTVLVVAAPARVEGIHGSVDVAADIVGHFHTTLDALDAAAPLGAFKVWVLTEGVRNPAGVDGVAQAGAWGLGRIVAGEHPEAWGGTVDVEALDRLDGSDLLAVLSGTPGSEDVIHIGGDRSLTVPRLTPVVRTTDKEGLSVSPAGTVLITAGLGALGLEAAQWLATRGARRLVLVGRRSLPARAEWASATDAYQRRAVEVIRFLESAGVSVKVVSLDVTDAEAVIRFVQEHNRDHPPITGIVHAAGGVYDELVDYTTREGLDHVFGAKALGAWTLHEVLPPGTLDFFVAFSSCGQLARLSGQSAYAAANSVLDAIVQLRSAQGEPGAVSLAWTSWRGMGLSSDLTTTLLEGNARGLDAVSGSEALHAWTFADRFTGPYKVIMRSVPVPAGLPVPPMFQELTHELEEDTSEVFWLDPAMDEEQARATVTDLVHADVAAELSLPVEDLGLRRPLVELGVDSVMAVALRMRLQRRFALSFPSTVLWAKPTVHELGGFIHEALAEGAAPQVEGGVDDDAAQPLAS